MSIISIILISILGFFTLMFLYDLSQRHHTIWRNFPVVGHFRNIFISVGAGIRQYWVASDKEEMPFNRHDRNWVYATAKKQNNNFGFGTTEQLYQTGYPIIKHAVFPLSDNDINGKPIGSNIPSAKVIGKTYNRKNPYRPTSIVNISAMSFGSLGKNAITALNIGAKGANCYHNTGEGGISPYHMQGADLVWQIGTGYFGSRDKDGNFSKEMFKDTVKSNPNIKMIEIKLSQGAKPGKGGILPKEKITAEIAQIRGIPIGKDCISPTRHSAFSNIDEMIDFIESLADISGIPVGIKSAVGESLFWKKLAKFMANNKMGPDFITIDGGEGGTGAAPLAFTDHVSLPFKVGFKRIYTLFQEVNLNNNITWIGSAQLGFPDRAIVAFAMGCDLINIARETMLSIGCIQARLCHTGHCPTGITTHNKRLQRGLAIESKSKRCTNFIKGLRKEILQLSHACGYEHPCQFTGNDIEFSSGVNEFTTLGNILGYEKVKVPFDSSIN